MMREIWYVLQNGGIADPRECAPDESGVLRHKSGAAVAMRGQVPSTRRVNPDEEGAQPKSREMKPEEPERGYRTRESKAGKD